MAIDLNLKSLNNIPWYGQLGIFSVFGVIIAGLGWYFFVSGLSEQIAVKQSQLDGLRWRSSAVKRLSRNTKNS